MPSLAQRRNDEIDLGPAVAAQSPWAPARLRQEMQTGGRKEVGAKVERAAESLRSRKEPRPLARTLEVISAPSIAMAGMIERGQGR